MPSVGQAIPHDSAVGHVTGQAPYIDDLHRYSQELVVDFVGARFAAGTLTRIDTEAAARVPGVVAVFTHRDLVGDAT